MGDSIRPYDALGRYHVASSTGDPYLVDLLAWDGEGQCTCQDWEFRIGAHLRNERPPEKRFCKHIIAARNYLTDEVIQKLIAAKKEG